jgi:outer membrane protein assembly factor BamB
VIRAAALATVASLAVAGCGTPADDLDALDAPVLEQPVAAEVPVSEVWSYDVGPAGSLNERLQVAVADGRAFVASGDGVLVALDAASGEPLWRRNLERPLSGGPAVGDGLVVIGSREGELFGLSADNGESLWSATLSSEILAPADIGQGVVVVRTNDGRLFALEPESGARRWVYDRNVPPLSLRGHSSPVLVGGGVVAGFDNGRLAALTLDEGTPVWEATIGVPQGRTDLERMVDIDADPVIDGTDVYAASYQGRLAALNLRTGRIGWAREISVHSGLTVDESRVYVSDDQGRVWALDRATGASVWRQDALSGLEITAPVVFGDHVVVAAGDGNLYWLSRRDGSIVDRRNLGDARIRTAPTVAGDRLYAIDLEGEVRAWELSVGDGGNR